MAPPTTHDLITAYRQLYRQLLRAVQYAKPARYVVRARLSHVFRTSPVRDYDAAKIARTLEFLDSASRVRGLEHRIVKNLVHVRWGMGQSTPQTRRKTDAAPLRDHAYRQFEQTLQRMNESLGLCIK